jgi:hypothetical protein
LSDDLWSSSSTPNGDDDYSVRNFYTRATDNKGHGATIRVPILPDLHAELGGLIALRRYPDYKTIGDFVRDAIMHRLRQLDELGELPPALMRKARLLMSKEEAIRFQESIDDQRGTVDEHKKAIDKARSRGLPLTERLRQARAVLSELDGDFRAELQRIIDDAER